MKHPTSYPLTASPRHAILLSATSASVLAYEILLMRLLSIGLWHHLAYSVISMALLGFGAAGSLLFLFFRRIRKNPEAWLVTLAGAAAVSYSLSFSLSQKIGLDPLLLIWQSTQWFNMVLTYLIMAIPFLLAGGIVGIILIGAGEKVHRMYAVDLLGAGCGALAIVPVLYLGPPWILLSALGGVTLLGAIWCCLRMGHPMRGIIFLLVSTSLIIIVYIKWTPVPRIHETKGLPMTLAFPDARIDAIRSGPLGMIHVVESSLIRHFPGLSLNFGLDPKGKEKRLPEQKALFIDADSLSPITRFTGHPDELEYLDYTTMALPYHIRKPEKVLIIGAGGGADLLLSLRHQTPEIIALEANNQIADLLTGPFAEYSGRLYARPEVKLVRKEARQFLHASKIGFDQIHLSLVDSFGASSGGLHSAMESYLYTSEAFQLYLARLSGSGLLSVTRWLKLPPRDSLRIVATALDALRKMGLSDHPEGHLLFIRSWKTSTIIVSKTPFTNEEYDRVKRFCDERSFDLAYYAGMGVEQANRYDVQKSPDYYTGASALSGPGAESFLNEYVFDITPTTDDRPYFSHFFRWEKAKVLYKHLGRDWLPMVESGYIFILATLVQAAVAGLLLILMPLLFLRRAHKGADSSGSIPQGLDLLSMFLYFGSIGMAFMFLEMALIPKYILLLSSPVYSAAIVLSTVLVFAGLGSLCVRRVQDMGSWFLWIPMIVIALWVGFHGGTGHNLFGWALGSSFSVRLAIAILLISMLSFFLGWPFPAGLRLVTERSPSFVPWAWGINGCASVVGAVLGKCIALSMGFRLLMLFACALYLVAVVIFQLSFGDIDRQRKSLKGSFISPRAQ